MTGRSWLKSAAFLLGGLLIGVLLGALVLFNSPKGETNGISSSRRLPPVVGAPVMDFELPALGETKNQSLSALKGKPVLINFWATWCPPCKEEMPLLQRTAEKYGAQLVILGVDYQEDDSTVQTFVDEMGVRFPILMDRDGRAADSYFAKNFPTSYFVDADGVLKAQHLGGLTEDLLARYLKTIGIEP